MIVLRPRQEVFVARCLKDIEAHGRVLGVAPTGAGKSIMIGAVASRTTGRVLILVHREELLRQNRAAFKAVCPGRATGVYAAWEHHWAAGQNGVTFAMVPTLARARHIGSVPDLDLVIIDEAHHAVAPSYRRIIAAAEGANKAVRVLGVTATPVRGDRKALGNVFRRLADEITLGELIGAGHLVTPRAMVLDVGVNAEIANLPVGTGEYDLEAAGKVLAPVTDRVVAEWGRLASERRTVVFCSTCDHATGVTESFRAAGYTAECVTGKLSKRERAAVLRRVDDGTTQILVNVAVATEGWDCQPVSCVVLLRPSSYQSTMIQMIGRGLRTVDPTRYPGLTKTDCLVLDFGRSLVTHGGLEQLVDLRPRDDNEEARRDWKDCPKCGAHVPLRVHTCAMCGYEWPAQLRNVVDITEFRMVELDLMLRRSKYRWLQINERTRMVSAINTWTVVFCDLTGIWHTFGGHDGHIGQISTGAENTCIAAGEDHMRRHGDAGICGRSAAWLAAKPTTKQVAILARWGQTALDRYEASCLITLQFARREIVRQMQTAKHP